MNIAVVVPRYGPEIGGGAEALARWMAESLAPLHNVTVLTTRALDYQTWENHYPEGETLEDGVHVLRFSVPRPRVTRRFNRWSAATWERKDDVAVGAAWIREQGPNSPDLLAHLGAEGSHYDVVVFVPYLYATTYDGLPLVADRSVLVPAVHDEAPAWLRIMDRTFKLAQGLAFSTSEEQEFCRLRFGHLAARSRLVGIGVDDPPSVKPPAGPPYVLYLGRIDQSKGCAHLLECHSAATRADPATPRLIMAGRAAMDLPYTSWLEAPGFVDERRKHELLAGAVAVVLPSSYESLSISVLEAWAHGRPVLVSSSSPVLVGQVRRAGGGLWFSNAEEYHQCLSALRANPAMAHGLGQQGRAYTRGRFRSSAVRDRLEDLLMEVGSGAHRVAAGATPHLPRNAGDAEYA